MNRRWDLRRSFLSNCQKHWRGCARQRRLRCCSVSRTLLSHFRMPTGCMCWNMRGSSGKVIQAVLRPKLVKGISEYKLEDRFPSPVETALHHAGERAPIFPNSREPTQRPGSRGNPRVRILSRRPETLPINALLDAGREELSDNSATRSGCFVPAVAGGAICGSLVAPFVFLLRPGTGGRRLKH